MSDKNIDVPDKMSFLSKCDHCAIRHKSICGALTREELAELNQISIQKQIKAGQTIVSDTEEISYFANIISGVIKLTKSMADGRQQIVALLFPPDFLGRVYRSNHTYFAEAATNISLCCFPHAAFEKLLKKYPDLEHRLFEHSLNELDAARDWMLLLGRKTAEEKVSSFLMLLAKHSRLQGCGVEDNNRASFALPLTRADMADYLGLTIETVSRQISKLKARKVIHLIDNRHIEVNDLDALLNISGGDEFS